MIADPSARCPGGTVAVVTGDLSRYAAFSCDLVRLRVPESTVWTWMTGISVASNLNRAILQSSGDWFWILGDDHRFEPSLLVDLLDRMYEHDLDVVVPLCCYRKPPFGPVLHERLSRGKYRPMQWDELPTERGLWRMDGEVVAGNAGMLIRRRVLDAIGDPWFEVGKVASDQLGEDIWFSEKCHAQDIPIHVAMDLSLGHITPITVWPAQDGARVRHVALELDPDGTVRMPVYNRTHEDVIPEPDEAMEWTASA